MQSTRFDSRTEIWAIPFYFLYQPLTVRVLCSRPRPLPSPSLVMASYNRTLSQTVQSYFVTNRRYITQKWLCQLTQLSLTQFISIGYMFRLTDEPTSGPYTV
jgi:hypothetical protein